jgi:hypothetical protein
MKYEPKTTAKCREEFQVHMDYMAARYDRHTAGNLSKSIINDLKQAEACVAARDKEIARLLNAMKVAGSMPGQDWLKAQLMLAAIIAGEECPIKYEDMFPEGDDYEPERL